MNITLQTPKVYQYPPSGRPDEGLEVYLWPEGSIDCYLNGRETPFTLAHPILYFLADNTPYFFDLITLQFDTLENALEQTK